MNHPMRSLSDSDALFNEHERDAMIEETETLEADAINIMINLNRASPTEADTDHSTVPSEEGVKTLERNELSRIQPPSTHQPPQNDRQRSLRPKKARKPTARAAEAAASMNYEMSPPPITSPRRRTVSQSSNSPTTATATATSAKGSDIFQKPKPDKPKRPLTAYHIFFQIEREYIIQTTDNGTPDSNDKIHDNKSYLLDVPQRYRAIKLASDWYAGPGKKQKRRHRKSHGKIGFLELSRVISQRWATLQTDDAETKEYVTRIAARELEEYKVEMKEWKELYGDDDEIKNTKSIGDNNKSEKKKTTTMKSFKRSATS